ncbi:CDP-alcohol phosphatidyltransferase family protein [Roseococcus sp. DSY-14]|uniref:CDP-alcohol phosphatidyltransferase family protein n=1 Tax=Roseococcus sp. DSY-14 TaxID=3369650 RepID=UPI00387ACDE9
MPAGADPPPGRRLALLPNLITLGRLVLVPATVWLMLQQRLDLAFLCFLLAGLSDALDGWLARVLDARSPLGAMLDPLADKALLVCVFVTLALMGLVAGWLALLVVLREVLILGGIGLLWARGQRPEIAPLRVSKLNTFAQIALAALALFVHGWVPALAWALAPAQVLVAVTTVLSLLAYARAAARATRR